MIYGCEHLMWAPFAAETPEQPGKLPAYGTPVELGALNKITETPAMNEAKGYGNNGLQEYVNKFKECVLATEVTSLARADASAIYGAKIESETKKNLRFRSSDSPPYGGAGFVNNQVIGGKDCAVGVFYPKVKAMLQGVEYNTSGENITLANTIGVVAGFLLGYVLASKRVFEANYSMPSFLIYFGTFLGGLVLADVLITVTHRSLIVSCPEWFAFLVSKGVSVVVPFFAMYFARKVLYAQLRRKERKDAHE